MWLVIIVGWDCGVSLKDIVNLIIVDVSVYKLDVFMWYMLWVKFKKYVIIKLEKS